MENNLSNEEDSEDNLEEYSEFNIDTCNICREELFFFNDPDYKPWKKYHDGIKSELEHSIQSVLLHNVKPTESHSEEKREYFQEQFNRCFDMEFKGESPFYIGYFVVTYSTPLEERIKPNVSFAARDYFYLFSYDSSVKITYSMITEDKISPADFDLLFAFGLRQCNMMKVSLFLNFQLEKNFNSDLKFFHPYLTQLTRTYSSRIFTDQLTTTIEEWLSNNKPLDQKPRKEKVKTNLTVDNLAYLFRALVDLDLFSNENKAAVIRMIADNMQSKMREDLSKNSIEKKFFEPTDDAIAFWIDQFKKLAAKAEKLQENNLK